MTPKLQGKVVLVTGASSGFGADAAQLFAEEGCRVVLSARRVELLEKLGQAIVQNGGEALVSPMDVTVKDQIDSCIKHVISHYGRIDILFNNAGFGRLDWLENLDPERDIDSQLDVNLRGVIQVTRGVLPHMLSNHAGCIINMSSVAGRIAAPMYAIYSATKYGVRGFTEALRREVAVFGIHVCGIYPGPAITKFSTHSNKSADRRRFRSPQFLNMTSQYVAKRVVGLAKRPRRTLVIPWWFRPIIALDHTLPGLVDWLLKVFFVKRMRSFDAS